MTLQAKNPKLTHAMKLIARVARSLAMTLRTDFDNEWDNGDEVCGAIVFNDNIYLYPANSFNNRWDVMYNRYIPGRFNPRDGGTPPDSEEKGLGNCMTFHDALLLVFKSIIDDRFGEILMEAEMEVGAIDTELAPDVLDDPILHNAGHPRCSQCRITPVEQEGDCCKDCEDEFDVNRNHAD